MTDKELIKQFETKPVAWMYMDAKGKRVLAYGAVQPYDDARPLYASPQPEHEHEPVAEVKAKMTGGNVGIATVIHEIYSPFRDRLRPGDKLYLIRT